MQRMSRTERLVSKVAIGDGCWPWRGGVSGGGYGHFTEARGSNPQGTTAHRAIYTLLVGPVPAEMALDHLCRNRLCVNPAHLEPVTDAENNRRASGSKELCVRGHPFTPDNTYVPPKRPGRRYCRACHRMRVRSHRER